MHYYTITMCIMLVLHHLETIPLIQWILNGGIQFVMNRYGAMVMDSESPLSFSALPSFECFIWQKIRR